MNLNDTTRKYPRTLEQAFGAHTSRHVESDGPKMDWQDKLVIYGCIVCSVAVTVLLLAE